MQISKVINTHSAHIERLLGQHEVTIRHGQVGIDMLYFYNIRIWIIISIRINHKV